MEKERIVPMAGFDGYCVTNTGIIIGKQGRQLIGRQSNGYHYVSVRKNNKTYSISAARLIYASFFGQIPKGKEIDHKDGDRLNNHINNLRLVTHKENMNNPITRRRLSKPKKRYPIQYEKVQ